MEEISVIAQQIANAAMLSLGVRLLLKSEAQ